MESNIINGECLDSLSTQKKSNISYQNEFQGNVEVNCNILVDLNFHSKQSPSLEGDKDKEVLDGNKSVINQQRFA